MKEQAEHVGAREPESLPTRLSQLLRELARVPEAGVGAQWIRALEPGTVVGRFEIVRELGRGGFGIVYEARDRELGRAVAFKAVRGVDRADANEERLLREAEAAARLSHPNIVTLFDVGRSEQGPYLVFELLRGRTLARRLEQGPLSAIEALRIAIEIAKAVAHAHAHGVVHRDLSPGNVFLCEEGHVKVLDLGMAHAFGRRRVEGGTPGYMAPEQRRGAPEDERTDVYALGVILHRALAGELPFPDDPRSFAGPAPVLDVPGAPGLGEYVARMLEPDPVKRPRDATVVLPVLTGILAELERTKSGGSTSPARRRRRSLVRVALPLAAGVAVALATAWGARRAAERTPPAARVASTRASIAVLPFADLSPTRDKEYFSDGLAEEILIALARIDGLRVPSRTSSFFFKGRHVRLAEIGRELNVGTVLEGSVRTAGNRVRVTAQVVSVADGNRVWGQTYDRELTDVFAVQEDIARAVAAALDVKLLGGTLPGSGHATGNPEVYAQFLAGRQQYHRVTREGYRLAVAAYEKALAIDPGYAPAWAGLGLPLYALADEAGTPAAVAEGRERALAAAEKAVALAPDLPDALSTRAVLRAVLRRDWTGARADLERALELNRNDADSRRRYGVLLAILGRLPDGIAEVRRSIDLDPLGQAWGSLGALYQGSGELELSAAAYRRFLEISPGSAPHMLGLARALLLQSKPKAALEVLAGCPAEEYRLWGTAVAEHTMGNAAASQRALQALVARFAHTSALRIAEVHAWRGEKEPALQWLERASGEPGGLEEIRPNPFLRRVEGEPRYLALLEKLKLPAR